ncbi:MAG: Arm DNA-binding domain-containing protein, partial [Rubrivivax sp.]
MDEKTTKRATRVTDAKLAAMKLPAGKNEARVLVAPGLYLHLRQRSGGDLSKHWQYRAQVEGARRWLSLGEYPAVSLDKATDELRKHQTAHEAAKKGEADHPVIATRFARKGAVEQPTVAEAFDLWIADKRLGSKRKGGKPVRDRTVQVLTENFDHDVRGRIGDAKIGRLTKTALQTCI